MRRALAALACAALVAGCASAGGVSARLAAGKAIADGWAGLDGAALAADAAVRAGLLKGPTAATVSQDLKLASASLTAATTAYKADSSADVAAEVASAAAAVAAILTIVAQAQGQTP